MGNLPSSLSLTEWARYCDCLQSSEKFKFKEKPQQPSQCQSNIEQKIPPKKQQPRRAMRQDELKINIIPQPSSQLKQTQQFQKAKIKTQALRHNYSHSHQRFYETPLSQPKSLIPRQRRNEIRRIKKQENQESSETQIVVPISSIGNPKLKGRKKNASKLLSMKSSNFELDAIQISEIDEHHQQPSQDHSEYIIPEQKTTNNPNYSGLN